MELFISLTARVLLYYVKEITGAYNVRVYPDFCVCVCVSEINQKAFSLAAN